MRVLVSVDMEGVAGVVDRSDFAPGAPGWERGDDYAGLLAALRA